MPAGDYVGLSLSPDGSRAAVTLADEVGNDDLWIVELRRGALTRVTREPGFDGLTTWPPTDGSSCWPFRAWRSWPR
jgi:Tol biopolymer transport system component